MATPFSTWLRAEMAARGLDNRQLATSIDVGDSTVHGWLEQDALPNVRSIVSLAHLFSVPTDTIVRLAGYDVVVSADASQRDTRRAELLAKLPRFAEIAEKITKLSPDKQDAYLSMIERILPSD